MKKIIINIGRNLIDIMAFISLMFVIIFGFSSMIVNDNRLPGLAVLIIGVFSTILIFFHIYIIISIYDNLKEINEKITYAQENNRIIQLK